MVISCGIICSLWQLNLDKLKNRVDCGSGGWVGHHIQIMNTLILDQKNVFTLDSQWNYTKKKEKEKRKTNKRKKKKNNIIII